MPQNPTKVNIGSGGLVPSDEDDDDDDDDDGGDGDGDDDDDDDDDDGDDRYDDIHRVAFKLIFYFYSWLFLMTIYTQPIQIFWLNIHGENNDGYIDNSIKHSSHPWQVWQLNRKAKLCLIVSIFKLFGYIPLQISKSRDVMVY